MSIEETEEHLIDPVPGTIVMQRPDYTSCRSPQKAMNYVVRAFNKAAGENLALMEG